MGQVKKSDCNPLEQLAETTERLLSLEQVQVLTSDEVKSVLTILQKGCLRYDKKNQEKSAQLDKTFRKIKNKKVWRYIMKIDERKYTSYVFDGDIMSADELKTKLEAISVETWEPQNDDLMAAYPANSGETWNGIHITKGTRDDYGYSDEYEYISVQLLLPTPDPNYQSGYWDKFEEVLQIFEGHEPMSQYDWRETQKELWEKQQVERAQIKEARSKGTFHVLNNNGETALITNSPAEAYNNFVQLPNTFEADCKAQIIQYHSKYDEELYNFETYGRNDVLRVKSDETSKFESNHIYNLVLRRSEQYRVGNYSYRRHKVYNLNTGKWSEHCAVYNDQKTRNASLDLPVISRSELEKFNSTEMMDCPIQPRLMDGSVVEVKKPEPTKYIYTEPYSGKRHYLYPSNIKDEPTDDLLTQVKDLIKGLREKIMQKHALNLRDFEAFQLYINFCAWIEKHTGEDLYQPIPVPK